MNILIVTRCYLPQRNPRAFRAYALVNELCKRGHLIGVVAPVGAKVEANDNMEYYPIDYGNLLANKSHGLVEQKFSNVAKKYIRNISNFIFGDSPSNIIYSIHLMRLLREEKLFDKYDVVITISYPFYNLLAISNMVRKNNNPILIADCGDPLYDNLSFSKGIHLKYLERYVLQKFNFISIPIEEAKGTYLKMVPLSRIKVIPQGMEIINIPNEVYKKNRVTTFCYAGIFYEKIRNPKYFFEYLTKLNCDFRFIVYALEDAFTNKILQEYQPILKEKLIVKKPLNREDLILVMAKMDFVVNFNNDNSNQRPSKLIDYAMSRRPILSFNQSTFYPNIFVEFLNEKYTHQEYVDLSMYDIRHVVNQFETLMN